MNSRRMAMLKLSSIQFAAWELHMYLDTHPNDKYAKEKYKKYIAEYEFLLAEYEKVFGPIKQQTAKGNAWLSDPWPWDNDRECDDNV